MRFDLLLKGGHLIDPKNNLDAPRDLGISDGKIAAVDSDIPAGQAKQVLDVAGLYITPGLVDIHTHMYATPGWPNAWAGDNSILPDGFSFRSGVTASTTIRTCKANSPSLCSSALIGSAPRPPVSP